jgi:hypothetical protein
MMLVPLVIIALLAQLIPSHVLKVCMVLKPEQPISVFAYLALLDVIATLLLPPVSPLILVTPGTFAPAALVLVIPSTVLLVVFARPVCIVLLALRQSISA